MDVKTTSLLPTLDLKTLEQLLCRPEPGTKTKGAFWDDPHISQEMLKAHLNPNDEGASRRPGFIAQSVEWISQIMAPGQFARILDLGCGPGLYAEGFARKGYAVTGVDFSRRSIAYADAAASKQGLEISYRCADYFTLEEENAFDCAVMIYCDYGALTEPARAELLRRVHRALRPGGRFLLDAFSAVYYERYQEQQSWQLCPEGGFWNGEKYFLFQGNYKYPQAVTLEHYVVMTAEEVRPYYLWNHCYTRKSLASEVEKTGFRVLKTCGDVAGAPWRSASPTLAILLEKSYNNTK